MRPLPKVPGVRSAGARLRAGALRELQGRVSRRLLVQGTRGVSLLQREAGACDGSAPGGAGAAARALPAVDAVLSASGAVGAAQGRGAPLGRPHRLPARGARPAAAEGTAAGPTWWAGRGRVVHPVLRLRLAGDSSFPLAGAGRRLRAAGGRRALRAVAAAHARRGGEVAEGGAPPGAAAVGEKRGPARARARGRAGRRTRRIPCSSGCAGRRWTCGPLPESSPGAPSWRASPCTPIRTCMRTTGRDWSGYAATGHAVRWRWSVCHERRTAALPSA